MVPSVKQPQAVWQPALSKEHHRATFPCVEIPQEIIVPCFPCSLLLLFPWKSLFCILAPPENAPSRLVQSLGWTQSCLQGLPGEITGKETMSIFPVAKGTGQ